jgi:transcriptional regulator with XRE-family HTH domain
MTSLGEKLRTMREEKGLSIDSVARETNIARRYLAALEEEDFNLFPAEAYALGFLKNYSEYLGVDANEMLSLFKVIKIQEAPIPIKELLTKPKVPSKVLPVVIVLLVLFGGASAYLLLSRGRSHTSAEPIVHVVANYILESGVFEQRFYAGDSLTVSANGELYKFTLASFNEVVTIDAPAGPLALDLSQTVTVDIDNDGVNELEISLEDYSRTDPLMGAWIRFALLNEPDSEMVPAVENPAAVSSGSQAVSTRTVFTSTAPYPFTLQAQFQGYCMFRWLILREPNRPNHTEQYFSRGNELSIQAQNGIRLWVSNATAVKLEAIGSGRTQAVEIGGPGEVVVVDIAWVREETGSWRLAVVRLEN